MAFTTRAIGTLSRPFFPDGLASAGPGPLSKAYAQWSPFSTGLQLDLAFNAIVTAAVAPVGAPVGCTGLARLQNGLQIFAGGVPVYRTVAGVTTLVGAIGVSGDGVEQNDLIAFDGGRGFEPPPELRIDNFTFAGVRLPYLKFPQTPR
jgi:hypothetical protein